MPTNPAPRRALLAISLLLSSGTTLAPPARASWPIDGLLLTPQTRNQQLPVLASDGASGMILAWSGSVAIATSNIYAQRVDSSGTARWSDGGIAIGGGGLTQVDEAIASAPNHGAIVAWSRKPKDSNGDAYDLYAQRLDSLGNALWAAGGLALASSNRGEREPIIVSNGSSGAMDPIGYYVAFQRYLDGNVRLQFVDLSGGGMWTSAVAGGILLSSALSQAYTNSCIQDGVGLAGRSRGVLVAWEDFAFSSTTGSDVMIQRVSPAGVPLFTSGGLKLCGAPGDQYGAQMALVGGGNIIVTWQDERTGSSDIYAQKVNTAGVVQWATDGLPVCRALNPQSSPTVMSDGAGGAYILWLDGRGAEEVTYAQRIGPDGQPLWALDGIPVTALPNRHSFFSVASDGQGGLIVAWSSDERQNTSDGPLRAQRIDGTGQLLWGPVGVSFDGSTAIKAYLKIIPGAGNGMLAAWSEARIDTTEFDVYAYRLTAAAVADVPSVAGSGLRLTRASANPTDRGASFRLELPTDLTVDASVFDLQGRRVRSLAACEPLGAGTHTLDWDGRDARGAPAAPGVYLVRVRAGPEALRARVVVTR